MALATLKVAQELAIKVPSQLSVIGFSNMTAALFASPALTTIDQPFNEIGRTAVNTLLDIIGSSDAKLHGQSLETRASEINRNQANGSEAGNVKLLPVQLIKRDSVAAPQ
jgi:DNA-binding LacI/PurR family transcriptional regulator